MLTLRLATKKDIPLLKHWDKQPHVIASDPEGDWDWEGDFERDDPAVDLLIAEWKSKPIGVLQIIDPQLEQTQYWGTIGPGYRAIDIWIGESEYLGLGHGTTLMKMALGRCFSDDTVHTLLIDPLKTNTDAHRFYRKLGFQLVEERTFDQDECVVFEMSGVYYKSYYTENQ